ncbi:MAG TPA: amidase [Vicinamibacterales bacterium]|nr:amidase [Vicinamibacterales bacterium]
MDRRTFIRGSAVAGAGALAGTPACTPTPSQPPAAKPAERMSGTEPFELHEATIDSLQEAMRTGQLTARRITELYLQRIEALNQRGPELRAIIETNPEALDIAQQLDAERKAGKVRGPLHGIPVALKDNIDTHDRMTTTAGSLALEGSIPPQDSFIAGKMREAGAVLIAKANMSEWAYWRGLNASSGWSARGGQCRNPYALDRTPCGSSSGSGVAAAANLAAVTVGTETGGSIICPSSITGVVGVKPTVGLWSRAGIIPISHSQDSAGPMTRTVRDAAILLGTACGVDSRDTATARSQGRSHADYTTFLDPAGLKGARLGIVRNIPGFDERVARLFDEAIAAMKSAGADIVDPANLPHMEAGSVFQELPIVVLNYEFKANINRYFQSLGPDAKIKTLADLIRFNEEQRDREMPFFGQERLIMSEATTSLDDPEYRKAVETIQRMSRADGIDALMARFRLDALVAPTASPGWLIDHVRGDRFDGGDSAGTAAIAGYPDITVPMGFVAGLPVGVSFFGRAWSEPTLLKIAYAYEQATKRRQPPTYVQTVG